MIGNLAALDTEITNCTVKGTVTATTRCAGIIAVPSAAGAIKVENCDVNVTLNARLGLAAGIYCNGNNQNGDVTVSNCKVAGKINASAATDSAYACAGVVCRFYTTNKAINVTVENCEVTMDIDAGKAKTGGVIGYLADTANDYNDIVVKNCSYNGTIDTQTETVGGIIGHIYGSLAGSLNVTNCNVAGSISGTSNIGGVIGRVGNTIAGDFNVKNCHVSADVNASGNTSGGVVGCIAKETNVSGLYTFANCSYTGNFVGKGFSNGGIIGYVETSGTPTNDYVFKNCVVGGTVTSNRSSGGFIGYIVCGNLLVEDCEVRGVINMTTGQAKNNKVGGVIGMMNVVNATLSDVVFSGTLNATIAPTKPGSDNPDCHVGGLIGYIARTSAVVRMDNCQVNAALCFAEAGDYAFLYNKSMAIFIGGGATSSSARPNVIYGQNVNYNLKALANATAHDVVLVGEGVPSMGNTAVLGYQIKWNKDETYDLRYIMGMKDVYDTVGVQAEIRYNFGEGVNVRYENVKVENVYKEVVDEKTNTYRAEDFAMDYLYTLTITGIPKEYAVHAGDLQVALIPYGISDGTTEFGVTTVQGDMGGFVELEDTDFGKTKPEAIDDALIHIYAGDYNVEETVKPATATASEVSGGKNVRHWYTNATTVLVYDFTVEEEGWYDAYFHLRLKNESVRSNQIVISNGETTETFTLFYVATSTHTALKDSTNGTYLSDVFEIYLTPGEYKMTILPGWTGGASSGSLHYRDIYFVK